MVSIGINSMGIVVIISVFMGAVTTVQTAYQLVSGLVSKTIIGAIVSDSSILELGPTITSLVLAGKVGSSIASEIGTMRVSEQIDALEIMGVNAAGFLISPKILAAVITIPMLIILAISLSIGGGIFVGDLTGILSSQQFIEGARSSFLPFNLFFSLTKAFTFAFIISSVSAYQGYYTDGGSLEVGQASTRAVVFSCILILLSDYLLAQLLL
jgi:phospholipid/cholesterol/gamma-HCH transport system permease protein